MVTSTLVIGAGQAGLSLSRLLAAAGQEHVVLERGRIGERWRSERWDSLTLLTPNWLNTLPGSASHADSDGFLTSGAFTAYLERYARSFCAPVVEDVTVTSVEHARGSFRVATDRGSWRAEQVVLATGHSDLPRLPDVARSAPSRLVQQLHSSEYRSPQALAPGGVLVVGAGPSGQQIALELRRAGRDVVLAVGGHGRVPRRYRGRDIWWWLASTGDLDERFDQLADPKQALRGHSLPLIGNNGGEDLDLGVLHQHGVALAGRLKAFERATAVFADDLAETTSEADCELRRLLARIDAHAEQRHSTAPLPPAEPLEPLELHAAPTAVDLRQRNISTIVWATGYRRDYSHLRLPVLGPDGEINHREGLTRVPGFYVIGLRFQRTRKSHFIGGVGEDAAFLAPLITAQTPTPALPWLQRLRANIATPAPGPLTLTRRIAPPPAARMAPV